LQQRRCSFLVFEKNSFFAGAFKQALQANPRRRGGRARARRAAAIIFFAATAPLSREHWGERRFLF
jgi:hypothetical protein